MFLARRVSILQYAVIGMAVPVGARRLRHSNGRQDANSRRRRDQQFPQHGNCLMIRRFSHFHFGAKFTDPSYFAG
jgi:hypothetical protein